MLNNSVCSTGFPGFVAESTFYPGIWKFATSGFLFSFIIELLNAVIYLFILIRRVKQYTEDNARKQCTLMPIDTFPMSKSAQSNLFTPSWLL